MVKHFLPEKTEDLVLHCLRSYVYENEDLSLLERQRVVFNNKYDAGKVTLISGGGSGHEPGWAGFVGPGMLTATCQGDIFASPNYKNIKDAEKATHSNAGVIFLITNYTGDNLYFGMAAQELISKFGQDKVRILRATDDVSIGKSNSSLVGRRTLAGCVFVMKILGAASQKGYDIDTIFRLGEYINENIASVNAGLDHVHVPGHDANADYGKLGDNQMEIGLGIHNEPGAHRIDNVPRNEKLVPQLLDMILDKKDKERGFMDYTPGDKFMLLINNLAGLPIIEERALTHTVVEVLEKRYGIVPSRVTSGTFITSINAPIFTISLFNVTRSCDDRFTEEEIFELFDTRTEATSFPTRRHTSITPLNTRHRLISNFSGYEEGDTMKFSNDIVIDSNLLKKVVTTAAKNVIELEPKLTKWDTKMGDGDCGTTLEFAAQQVLKALDKGVADEGSVFTTLYAVLSVVRDDMGGTLGAILFIFTKSLINSLQNNLEHGTKSTQENFADSLLHALETLEKFTKAREGHRSLMDVLIPFCNTYASLRNLSHAISVSHRAAEHTTKLRPKLGRAAYVGGVDKMTEFPPDPGAYGIYGIISGLQVLS